jgi:hypothetical protein
VSAVVPDRVPGVLGLQPHLHELEDPQRHQRPIRPDQPHVGLQHHEEQEEATDGTTIYAEIYYGYLIGVI